jgi:hypothetical protein
VKRVCLKCGQPFTPKTRRQRRCTLHQGTGTGYSHNRDTAAQKRFRKALMVRSGGRCEEIDEETGERCTETRDLRACHLTPLVEVESYDPALGRMRCARHDRATDPKAR